MLFSTLHLPSIVIPGLILSVGPELHVPMNLILCLKKKKINGKISFKIIQRIVITVTF